MLTKLLHKIPHNLKVRKLWWKTKWLLAYLRNWQLLDDVIIIWITGTDWKTTTTCFTGQLLQLLGIPTAIMSTETLMINWKAFQNISKRTTAGSSEIYSFIKQAKSEGCRVIVLEVSSHALEQGRVAWIKFDYSIVTNVSHEHLDYHESLDEYALSKSKLLTMTTRCAIIPHSLYNKRLFTSSTNADILEIAIWDEIKDKSIIVAKNIYYKDHWTTFDLHYHGEVVEKVHLPVMWTFNLENLLFAIALSTRISRPWVGLTLKEAVAKLEKVPWRLDDLNFGQDFKIWLTFWVTPKAIEKLLRFAQWLKDELGKVILVFGATWGQHDKTKRPVMWQIAWYFADLSVITDDEPYTEDPFDILAEIESWIKPTWSNYVIIQDRYSAISYALSNASKGDIVIFTWIWNLLTRNVWWKEISWNEKEIIKSLVDENLFINKSDL